MLHLSIYHHLVIITWGHSVCCCFKGPISTKNWLQLGQPIFSFWRMRRQKTFFIIVSWVSDAIWRNGHFLCFILNFSPIDSMCIWLGWDFKIKAFSWVWGSEKFRTDKRNLESIWAEQYLVRALFQTRYHHQGKNKYYITFLIKKKVCLWRR